MNNERISVLMCSNKYDEYFCRAVQSILQQTYTSFEFIIVANDLTERLFNQMREFCKDSRIKLIRSNLSGLPANLNFGLLHCTSELIFRMDADDISYPKRFEILKYHMDTNSNLSVCGSSYDIIDESDKIIHSKIALQTDNEIRRALYYKNPFCHPSVVFRQKVLHKHKGYSNFRFAQDYDLWLRLSDDNTVVFSNAPETLLGYRDTGAEARGSTTAYLYVAKGYINKFFRTLNPMYIISSMLFVLKALFAKIMVRR